MNAFQIVDALVASFFGLIGIWAAVVRRHWFLRFVVVSVFLLSTLVITAHEVAIEFGIQIALVMVGVWAYRSRGNWQFQFSIETALLAMIVVAVASAVVGNAQSLTWWSWHFMISTGVCTAGYALLGLWLVFGQARLRFRLAFTLLGIVLVLAAYHFAEGTRLAIWEWVNNDGELWPRFAQHYEAKNVVDWFKENAPSVGLGAAIITSALFAARYTGWFSEAKTQSSSEASHTVPLAARVSFSLIVLAIMTPLLYIFYRLMTPTEIPVVEIQEPNGYDDIIAAGGMVDANEMQQFLVDRNSIGEVEFRRLMQQIHPALQRIEEGLKQSHFQVRYKPGTMEVSADDGKACGNVGMVLIAEIIFLNRFGNTAEQVDWALKMLPLSELLTDAWQVSWPESEARWQITSLLPKLDSAECRNLVRMLEDHDRTRPTVDEFLLPLRVKKETGGWERHYNAIMQELSGYDPYHSDRLDYQRQVARFRMLIAQLALQSYLLDHRQLPETLDELTPDYLSAVPVTPLTDEVMVYQRFWGGYAITCRVNDQQQPLIVAGPASPYLWQRLQEAWPKFVDWAQGFGQHAGTTDLR